MDLLWPQGARITIERAAGLVRDVAKSLRLLRELASEGLLARRGGGRSTRYERAGLGSGVFVRNTL